MAFLKLNEQNLGYEIVGPHSTKLESKLCTLRWNADKQNSDFKHYTNAHITMHNDAGGVRSIGVRYGSAGICITDSNIYMYEQSMSRGLVIPP